MTKLKPLNIMALLLYTHTLQTVTAVSIQSWAHNCNKLQRKKFSETAYADEFNQCWQIQCRSDVQLTITRDVIFDTRKTRVQSWITRSRIRTRNVW